MSKKWETKTNGGFKILSIHGPSTLDTYAGVVQAAQGVLVPILWDINGKDTDDNSYFDLVEDKKITERWYFIADGTTVISLDLEYAKQLRRTNIKHGRKVSEIKHVVFDIEE